MLRVQWETKGKPTDADIQASRGEVVGFVAGAKGTVAIVRCQDNRLRECPIDKAIVI